MKLNDIYTYLEKTINLKKKKQETIISPLEKLNINNLDKLWEQLKDIKLETRKEINPWKLKTPFFDSAIKSHKLTKNINLKKKISQSSSLLSRILLSKNFQKISILTKKIKTHKLIAWFIIIIFLLISDLILVLLLTSSWINNLKQITVLDEQKIETQVNKAYIKFSIADFLYKPFYITPINQASNLKYTIKVSKESSYNLKLLAEIYNELKFEKNISYSEIIVKKEDIFKKIEDGIKDINYYLEKINIDEKNEYYYKLSELKSIINYIETSITSINNNFDAFLNLIWNEKRKKYFIVFQNNDEIRATWGFMWSAWIIEIFKWGIVNFEKKDIYSYEWDINKTYHDKINPPKWIDRITTSFWLRDSNYFVDFQKSANSINFFLQKWWYDIDWVIFINLNTAIKLLEIAWPIKLDWVQQEISSENFAELMSILVESKISKEGTLWTPKQILFDFTKTLEEKIIKSWDFISHLNILLKEIKNREIVFNSFDIKENNLLKQLNINWKVDYLSNIDFNYPVYTSIWWNKTDRYINIDYKKSINILDNCDIETNLEIKLTHNFSQDDKQRILNLMDSNWINRTTDLINIQWEGINRDFLRVLLPKNSIIQEKENQTVEKFDDFNYIDLFTEVSPWETKDYNISYKIINPECKKYNFKLYKQSWIKEYSIHINRNWINYIYNNMQSDFMFE